MSTDRLILSALVFFTLAAAATADVHHTHVRPLDPLAVALLADGRQHSEFFRGLVERLERSDAIVYIQTAVRLPRGVQGHMQLATAVEGARYLRITLDREVPHDRLVGLLGHELMHAVEVALDQNVRDHASLRALYERIGHSPDGSTFDTRDAIAAGEQVLVELQRGRRLADRRYRTVTRAR
jgi:hypothetical protein